LRATAGRSEITLYTYFNEAPHQYTVEWYLKPNQLVKSVSNQDYGGGYTLEAPTVKDIRTATNDRPAYDTYDVVFNNDDTVTISIFDGWEKLPININPTLQEAQNSVYKINAKWYTETISISDLNENSLFADTSSPTLNQLLVLSKMGTTERNIYHNSTSIIPTKKFEYETGFSGTNNNGTVIINTNNVFKATGVGVNYSNITPFANNNGFTIAIDYKFDSSQAVPNQQAAILLGCYDRINGSVVGFALYNNNNSTYGTTGINVGYGNMFSNEGHSVRVGRSTQRNMIVIRHPANSSSLYIYSSKGSNGETLESNMAAINPIELDTQVLSENAVLCLGHLRQDINTNSTFSNNEGINTVGALGTIYWMKYWNEDLGAGECKQLAAWPHEKMTAIITSIDETKSNENPRPRIYLTNLNNSSHSFIYTPRFDTSQGAVEGWGTSTAYNICNNRILNGLPIRL